MAAPDMGIAVSLYCNGVMICMSITRFACNAIARLWRAAGGDERAGMVSQYIPIA
jgi:hypothetical protein